MALVKNYLLNLNLFESSDETINQVDEYQRRSNIISTRFYLITFVLALIFITTVFSLRSQTTIVTIEYPNKIQFDALPFNTHCPCARMSIPYGEFTSIQSTFHQVCSSDFVTDRWIEAIFSGSNSTYFYVTDFRTYGSAQFQALASFCRLIRANVDQSISLFYTTSLLTSQLQTETIFQLQVQASISQFQLTAPRQFVKQLDLVNQMIMANGLISGLQTNAILSYATDTIADHYILIGTVGYQLDNESQCICGTNLDCATRSQIMNSFGNPSQMDLLNDSEVLMDIPGLVVSCLPVNSLLLSTLECFYKQTCLDELLSFFPTTERFTAIEASEKSRFEYDSTIKTIVSDLMIEEWITNISYEKYYARCAPISCTYSTLERPNALFVLAQVIRSVPSLILFCGLLIPMIVQFIRQPRTVESTPLSVQIRQIKTKIKKILIELNIFKDHQSNQRQIYYQRIASRLYIFVLIISLAVFIFYSFLIQNIHHKIVHNPSKSEYNRLEQIYGDGLSCPCTLNSMNYSTFMNIKPYYHQICSSDFVSDQWIKYTSDMHPDGLYRFDEYRSVAGWYFLLLLTLCQESRQTIDDALQVFLQTQFVSSQVISQQLFERQMTFSISDWQSSTIERFVRTIQIIQAMNFGNQLYNYLTGLFGHINSDFGEVMVRTTQDIKNCSCSLSSACRSLLGIYDIYDYSENGILFFSVPNFFVSCSAVDALHQSTMECFYNRSCMLMIDQYMHSSLGSSFNFIPLDSNRNWPNETVESIIHRLMVDSWTSNVSFFSFYSTCNPRTCTFEYMGQNDVFFIVLSVIGIFGGLSLGWKLLIFAILRSLETIVDHFSFLALQRVGKNLFLCRTKQQIITRLYVILLVITLGVIYTFSASSVQPTIVQIIRPSFSTYQHLRTYVSNSTQCSCSQFSIKYESFFIVKPRFHPICSSEFTSDHWIQYLYGDGNSTLRFSSTDFRATANNQFQLLVSLCQISQKIIDNSLLQLETSDLINIQLLTPNQLDRELRTVINEFEIITPNLFLSTFNLIREMTGTNMIMTTLSTNWRFIPDTTADPYWTIHAEPFVYQGCNCGLSWKCVQPFRGMMVGCYPIEALLQTTLQCFYDQDCIDSNKTLAKLNVSTLETSQFNMNTTLESMLNYLMVEEYLAEISYERYYNQCAPSLCTYTQFEGHSTIDIITSLIGLYGGLAVITGWVAVILANLWLYEKHRVNPQNTQPTDTLPAINM